MTPRRMTAGERAMHAATWLAAFACAIGVLAVLACIFFGSCA